ncbi:MAG: fumarate reductase subunit D, partial [Ectothiorhodospira sp.]
PPEALAYITLRGALTHPLVALGLGVTVGLWLFHAAHRILHTLYDLGAPHAPWLPRVCYGGATAGAVVALGVALAWVLR